MEKWNYIYTYTHIYIHLHIHIYYVPLLFKLCIFKLLSFVSRATINVCVFKLF